MGHDDEKITRRDFLAKVGKWSPVVAGLVYGVTLGAGAVSSGCAHYGNYANYGNYGDAPQSSYCNGCRSNYVVNGPPGTYCNYLNYTDGCY